jgi:hypothetical protein
VRKPVTSTIPAMMLSSGGSLRARRDASVSAFDVRSALVRALRSAIDVDI